MIIMDGEQIATRPLFGGAIVVSMPERFVDVSQFREVPDNQEVFADGATDQSFIIELLETPDKEEAPDDSAALFHFNSIAHDNKASASQVELEAPIYTEVGDAGDIHRTMTWGLQEVGKYRDRQDKANHVRVFVACVRLDNVATDAVISFNSPVMMNPRSSAAQDIDPDAMEHFNTDEASQEVFKGVVETFEVKDWSLFG